MCGIVGYVGPQQALPILLAGLRRLEYRGYDSAGTAVVADGRVSVVRKAGRLEVLEKELGSEQALPGVTGIGHTRWATHGAPVDVNAHPHVDCGGEVAVIHNGIIENFLALRLRLEAEGHVLTSQTDTEVVAHLVEAALAAGQAFPDAVRSALRELEGSFAIAAVHAGDPEMVVAGKRDLPLVAGRGQGENFVASDFAAFLDRTRDGVILEDDQVAVLTPDRFEVTDLDGNAVTPYEHRVVIKQTLEGRTDLDGRLVLDELRMSEDELREVDKVFVVACGSAYHAGLVAKYAIEHWTRLPVEIEMASEFRYRDPVLDRNTLVIAISQSGETIDTLQAVRHARNQGSHVIAITNTVGSSISREADGVLYTHAGPEICVAATKTFATQMVALHLLALYLAQARRTMYPEEVAEHVETLQALPEKVERALELDDQVRVLAERYAGAPDVLFIGRHTGYPAALEGALKLKEISYIPAEGYPAGELKHGPSALVEPGVPVVAIATACHVYPKMLSNIQEVRARGADVIAVATEGDTEIGSLADHVLFVPETPELLSPVVVSVPLQLFAYHIAKLRGCDVDQPRNLAKSVTVE